MHAKERIGKMKCALGLMSGTSMDGIDVALVRSDGQMQVDRGPAMHFPYTPAHRDMLRQAIQDAKLCTKAADRPGRLGEIERELTEVHGAALSAFLRKQKVARDDIDLVGYHGHTVVHRPDLGFTVQLGDGAFLAELVRRPVIYNLRHDDMKAGGQGAPLVPVYHQALCAKHVKKPVAVLNLGGVGNVTWIGADHTLIAFDTGPGNALLDDWIMQKAGKAFDDGGALAARGAVNDMILADLLRDEYFTKSPPKSLDRETFSHSSLSSCSIEDGAATLAAFTAHAVKKSERWFPQPAETWMVTGGGRKNLHLMSLLSELLCGNIVDADAAGFDGDSLEAEAWAYLAVRSVLGLSITFPTTTGVPEPMTGGTVALPPK